MNSPLIVATAAFLLLLPQMSVILVFDGVACALFDGSIGVDRFPDAIERAAVLAAVKDATRRWRGGPKTGHP